MVVRGSIARQPCWAETESSSLERMRMLVDVRVTVFAADEHDHDEFDRVVAPQLVEIFGGLETTGPTSAREYLDEKLSSYEIRFSVRVEAPHARAAATSTKERVQQAMREAGIRGVVSVPDGWPVT
jgi:hypothetical protein